MPFLRQVFRGLSNLFRPQRAARDAADEVASFYSETAAALEADGLSRSEAMRAAPVQIGSSSTALRESVFSYGWENLISGLAMELRHILRRLRKTPGFTLTSIGTLALGLGASITLFSLINSVLLKPLPFLDSQRLVVLNLTAPGIRISDLNIAPSVYLTIKEETRVFENVAMWDQGSLNVTRREHPEETPALFAGDGVRTLDVQLGNRTVNWKQRTLRFLASRSGDRDKGFFALSLRSVLNGAQTEHKKIPPAAIWSQQLLNPLCQNCRHIAVRVQNGDNLQWLRLRAMNNQV